MSFSQEDRLLLNCSRTAPEDANVSVIAELLQVRLDWDYIIQSSIRHGVAPLLRNAIQQILPHLKTGNQVPAHAMERLEILYQTSRRRNQRLYQIVAEIARECTKAGIAVMGLKDLQLARSIYPDPALRPMGDIDLLIRPEDYEKAADCMFRLGFERTPFTNLPYILKYAWGHHFRRRRDNTYVDLQWNVMQIEWDVYQEGSFDFEIERMWKNAQKMAVDDYFILVPSLEDMLFHLCVHLDGHQFSELILLCDIYELIKQNESRIDWQYFIQIVNRYKAEPFTYYSLRLIEHLFQIDLPNEVLRSIKPGYFKTGFVSNLFGNLSRLHYELDDLCETVSAAPKTIQNIEVIARQQATCAMMAYKEIDRIIQAFKAHGGSYVCIRGSQSEKIFADSSLSAFNAFNLLVLETELPAIRKTLLHEGFQSIDGHDCGFLTKNIVFQSSDPVLEKNPTKLLIEGYETREVNFLLAPAKQKTNRQIAIKLLKSKFAKQNKSASEFVIRLNIIPLAYAQVLMYLCHQIGTDTSARFYELVTAMDFLETCPSLLQWESAKEESEQAGIADSFDAGKSLIMDFFGSAQVGVSTERAQTHIFEWARIGPETTESFIRFKRPFNYFRVLLTMDAQKDTLEYLWQSCKSQNKRVPLLALVLLDMAAGILQLFKKSPPPVPAYWVVAESNEDAKVKQRAP